MTTIYIPMEPQPEIDFYFSFANSAWYAQFKHVDTYDGEMRFVPPHKPGDEIEYTNPYLSIKNARSNKPDFSRVDDLLVVSLGTVTSCIPDQREGKWVWKIEVGEKKQ